MSLLFTACGGSSAEEEGPPLPPEEAEIKNNELSALLFYDPKQDEDINIDFGQTLTMNIKWQEKSGALYYLGVGRTKESITRSPYGDIFAGYVKEGSAQVVLPQEYSEHPIDYPEYPEKPDPMNMEEEGEDMMRNDRTVHIRLWSRIKGKWSNKDFEYQVPLPEVECHDDFDPVCGERTECFDYDTPISNNNEPYRSDEWFPRCKVEAKTYLNSCEARKDGASISHEGMCGGNQGADSSLMIIIEGEGSGEYKTGETVEISANPAKYGYVFDYWEGQGEIANRNSAQTTVVVSSHTTLFTAIYRELEDHTHEEAGFLRKSLDENTPDQKIAIAGDTDIPVSVYKFSADKEDISIGSFVSNIVGFRDFDNDATNDHKAVNSLALFYYDDGTAVKQSNGNASRTYIKDSPKIYFKNLDLVIEKGEETLIEIRANLNNIGNDNEESIATSGMTFAVTLHPEYPELRGINSGKLLRVNESVPFRTPNKTHVMNNHVTATLSNNQHTVLANGMEELIKFTLASAGDNSDAPSLSILYLNINFSDKNNGLGIDTSATNNTGTSTDGVRLYNDDNTQIGKCLLVDSLAVCTDINDEIEGGSETYRVEAHIAGVRADDKITTAISINASSPGDDGIVWKDGGNDGVNVAWIDLGESNTSTSRIENTLEN